MSGSGDLNDYWNSIVNHSLIQGDLGVFIWVRKIYQRDSQNLAFGLEHTRLRLNSYTYVTPI